MNGKIAIVCDNYKVEEFEKRLKKEELVFTKMPFAKGITTIKVFSKNQDLVRKICEEVESYFAKTRQN